MKPFKKVLMVSGGIALLLSTIAALGYALTDIPSAAASLKQSEAKARAAGLFITPQEYVDSITVPDSENCARLISPLLREYEAKFKETKFEDLATRKVNESAVLQAYNSLEHSFNKIDREVGFKRCIFSRDRERLFAILYPEYAQFKGVVRLLSARARVAVIQGDLSTAQTCWKRAATLTLLVNDEATSIGMFVSIACSAAIQESIRITLLERGSSVAWRTAAWETMNAFDRPYDFRAASRFEHITAIQSVNLFFDGKSVEAEDDDVETVFEGHFKWIAKIPRMRYATLARINEVSTGVHQRISSDPFDTKSIDLANKWVESLDQESPSYLIARFTLPMITGTASSIARDYARRNTLMQAIKLLENPSAKDLPLKGRYALDSDGNPLRLIRKNKKLIIYSIGSNDVDDGGLIERPTTGTRRDYDFGVAIPLSK